MLVLALNSKTKEVDWMLTFLLIMSLLFYTVTHYINLDFIFLLYRNALFIQI